MSKSYKASDNQILANLVAGATSLPSVSITYRVSGKKLYSWASTHSARAGWESLSEELVPLATELAKALIPVTRDRWGQIEVDVATGQAQVG